MEITFLNSFDIRISSEDSELDYSKSLNMKQPQTYSRVKFSCRMDEMYIHSYMAIPSRLQQHPKIKKILNPSLVQLPWWMLL